jgi:hypothetical protein
MGITMAGHAASIEGMRNGHKIETQNLKRRDNFDDLGVDDRIILKWTFEM